MKRAITLVVTCVITLSMPAYGWVDGIINFRGELNNWAETALAHDTLTNAQVWEVTIHGTAQDGDEFKFANWGWGNQWVYTNSLLDTDTKYTFIWTILGGVGNTQINGYESNKWYTFRLADGGTNEYLSRDGIVMETSEEPITIASVTEATSSNQNQAIPIGIALSAAKCAEEKIYVRWSTNNWATSAVSPATGSDTSYSADIPAMPHDTRVEYYALSTTATPDIDNDVDDTETISFIDDDSEYTVVVPEPGIVAGFAGVGLLLLRRK